MITFGEGLFRRELEGKFWCAGELLSLDLCSGYIGCIYIVVTLDVYIYICVCVCVCVFIHQTVHLGFTHFIEHSILKKFCF